MYRAEESGGRGGGVRAGFHTEIQREDALAHTHDKKIRVIQLRLGAEWTDDSQKFNLKDQRARQRVASSQTLSSPVPHR